MSGYFKRGHHFIQNLNTPLKFFALVIIILESVLIASWFAVKDPFASKLLLFLFIGVIILSLFMVLLLALLKPEALKGERKSGILTKRAPIEHSDVEISNIKLFKPLANKYGVYKLGFFEDYNDLFYENIKNSESLTLMFIHSRRWRENHDETIRAFLLKKRAKLIVFLPNLDNDLLLASLKVHFDDGEHLPSFISDAYRYFFSLLKRFPEKVEIRAFDLHPVYSFYRFDSKLFIAMYPNTANKRSVPTMEIAAKGEFWDFVNDDLQILMSTINPLPEKKIEQFADINQMFTSELPKE